MGCVLARQHRQNVDFDAGKPVQHLLCRAAIERLSVYRKAERLIKAATCRGFGNADRGMIDAEKSLSTPATFALRSKLQQLERMAFRIAELDRGDATCRVGKRHWAA